MNWSNEMGSRERAAWLLLVKGEEVVAFTGNDVADFAVIRGTDYKKNGKWSHTTYRLEFSSGVRAIAGRDGWETGRFIEGLADATGHHPVDTWRDVAAAVGVSVPAAMAFVRDWRPKAAEALDLVEEKLAALDDATASEGADEPVRVTVSFGGPTNRSIADGFWTSPKAIPGHGGEIRLIDPVDSWVVGNIAVVGIVGTVVSATHARGYHGGYMSVVVAVVPGTEVVVPEEESGGEISIHVGPEPAKVEVVDITPPKPATTSGLAALAARFAK